MIQMTDISALESRINRAEERYGPVASTHEGLGVACEEWDELRQAIRDNDMAAVKHECLDLAAVLIRMAIATESDAFVSRSVK